MSDAHELLIRCIVLVAIIILAVSILSFSKNLFSKSLNSVKTTIEEIEKNQEIDVNYYEVEI